VHEFYSIGRVVTQKLDNFKVDLPVLGEKRVDEHSNDLIIFQEGH